jgi:hypothetical protein
MEIGWECDQDDGTSCGPIGMPGPARHERHHDAWEHGQMIDHDKLRDLANTLTDDQRRLLREGLAGGADVDPQTLAESLKQLDADLMLLKLVTERPDFDKAKERVHPIGPNVATPDPPLTRW